jgi:hypothetical protein
MKPLNKYALRVLKDPNPFSNNILSVLILVLLPKTYQECCYLPTYIIQYCDLLTLFHFNLCSKYNFI